jgi:hypothetical protein
LIEALDGYEALVITFDGGLRWTERFPFASVGDQQFAGHLD